MGRLEYVEDLLNTFKSHYIQSTNWIWKSLSPDNSWFGYEILHDYEDGTQDFDKEMTAIFNKVWSQNNMFLEK